MKRTQPAQADPDVAPAETEGPRPTRAEQLRRELSEEIVRGVLKPGTPLDETELAHRFGVSRTPVREAIRQLVASGLVEARAHRSAVVAHPSDAQLVEMFEAMADLEGLCAGHAARRMTAAERRTLEQLHAEMGALVRSGDPAPYTEANDRFHDLIYQGAHNALLIEFTRAARSRVSPFRHAQFQGLGRLSRSHAEHDRVVTAILRGDARAAQDMMRAHIDIVRTAYDALSDGEDGGAPPD